MAGSSLERLVGGRVVSHFSFGLDVFTTRSSDRVKYPNTTSRASSLVVSLRAPCTVTISSNVRALCFFSFMSTDVFHDRRLFSSINFSFQHFFPHRRYFLRRDLYLLSPNSRHYHDIDDLVHAHSI